MFGFRQLSVPPKHTQNRLLSTRETKKMHYTVEPLASLATHMQTPRAGGQLWGWVRTWSPLPPSHREGPRVSSSMRSSMVPFPVSPEPTGRPTWPRGDESQRGTHVHITLPCTRHRSSALGALSLEETQVLLQSSATQRRQIVCGRAQRPAALFASARTFILPHKTHAVSAELPAGPRVTTTPMWRSQAAALPFLAG